MEKFEKKSLMQVLKETLSDYLKHPKKLLPTIILTVVWIAFSLMSTLGANIPFLRFLYTLTYANGGMFGGFFGAVGGIFGKAVFAAVVNVFVLSICEKKNPFKGLKTGFKNTLGGGVKAVSPFLIGGGTGILLYWFFNMTSSAQNCAISVACVLAGLKALSSKNSILFSGIFWLLGKISKGKSPSKVTANRILAGLTAGFAISFPITFIRLPILIVILGALLVVVGIIIPLAMNKKAVAVMLLILLSLPSFGIIANAEENSFTMKISSFYADFKTQQGQHYTSWDDWMYYGFYKAGEIAVTKDSDGNYTFTIPGYDYSFTNGDNSYSVTIPSITFKGADFAYSSNSENYYTVFNAQLDDILTVNYIKHNNKSNNDYITYYQLQSFELPLWFNKSGINGTVIDVHSSETKCMSRSYSETVENPDTYTHWSDYSGLFSQGFTVTGYQITDSGTYEDDTAVDENVEYKPYRGFLTYTSGRTNKNGQPFPDLMDFDGDGEMTWLDVAIQKELSHDPDYLDRPESKAAGVLIGVLTAIFGAAAGAVAGSIGGAIGGIAGGATGDAVASVLGGAEGVLENIEIPTSEDDLGPHITRDSDGDLNVTDPATGEKRLYKANGDGTYTNPLTGATYTEAELKSSLESREENADTIRQDEATRQNAIDKQREDNQGKSDYAKAAEAENAALRAKEAEEEARREYIEKLKDKYSVESNEEKLREQIGKEQGRAEIEVYEQLEKEKGWKESQEYAENVKQTADVAIDVLAEVTPGGKALKDEYSVLTSAASNFGDYTAGYKSAAGAILQTAIDSGAELAKNHSEGAVQKLASNILGDGIKASTDAKLKGENTEDAQKAGLNATLQGAVNAAVDLGFDAYGDKLTEKIGLSGDKVVGKLLGKEITKGTAGSGTKTLINDVAKNSISVGSDEKAEKLDKLRESQEQAEADANKQAAEQFREAQKKWAEKKEDD